MKLKVMVEHEISPDPEECAYGGDFWGKDLCRYHTHRDRTHGRKAPKERNVPKCTLFDCWLDKEYHKCPQCVKASEMAAIHNAHLAEEGSYGIRGV